MTDIPTENIKTADIEPSKKWPTLFLSAAAIFLAMGLWFSASVVVPTLSDLWVLDDAGRAGLTISVQIGFVVGSVISALLNLADRIRSRYLITVSVFLAALCTALIAAFVNSLIPALVLRFLTGLFMVGVYPVLMKLIATWTKADRGLGIGLLTGALTVGSASPNLLAALGGIDNWRLVLFLAAAFASFGGAIVFLFIHEGPYGGLATSFDWKYAAQIFRIKELRLANMGYLGHMWELFAMWAWVGLFLSASFKISGLEPYWASLTTFIVIAAGGIGSVLAGLLADRFGRTVITIVSLLVSGICAVLVGFLFGAHPALLTTICLIWGFTVVADSAQFSAAISELCQKEYIGTALTIQTSLGFLLTVITIRIIPSLVSRFSWQSAFALLALGPAVGIWAMYSLRRTPAASKMAGGSK